MSNNCPGCGNYDIVFGESMHDLTRHNDEVYHTDCLIKELGGFMEWIRVYKNSGTSYLCRRVGGHYEIQSEGPSSSIEDLVERLNKL